MAGTGMPAGGGLDKPSQRAGGKKNPKDQKINPLGPKLAKAPKLRTSEGAIKLGQAAGVQTRGAVAPLSPGAPKAPKVNRKQPPVDSLFPNAAPVARKAQAAPAVPLATIAAQMQGRSSRQKGY